MEKSYLKRGLSLFMSVIMLCGLLTTGILPTMAVSAAEAEQPVEAVQTESDGLPEQEMPMPGENEAEKLHTESVESEEPDVLPVEGTGTGDFVVTGGTAGTDYTFADGVLTILSSTKLTIRNADPNTPTAHRILVPADVKAELVFAGVNIRTASNSPFTLTPKKDGGAQAYIVLADGSENTLYSGDSNYSALRAGETTTVVIDDSIVNRDQSGNVVTPAGGKVPYDVTLENGTVLHKGDNLNRMDSPKRGKLSATGGFYGAGIGGSNGEFGGTIILNGGEIEAQNASPSSGWAAGIGGGGAGDGGNIIINGGLITARGPYHGAGVGGGCHEPHPQPLDPGLVRPAYTQLFKTGYSGNITINGGLSYAYGNTHGEAFGDGCVSTSIPSKGYKVIVTGGTILPYRAGGRGDISCVAGKIYVTGGSLKVEKFGQSGSPQPVYGNMEETTQVLQTLVSMEYLGKEKVGTTPVEEFELLIGGKKYEYGMPSYTDDKGILYLWLPSDSQGKEVTVNTAVRDKENGTIIRPSSFFITNVTHGSKLKQYYIFDIPRDIVPQDQLTKRYDGLPFDASVSQEFLDALMSSGGIPVDNPENGKLTDRSAMSISSRRLDDETLEPDTDFEGGDLSIQSAPGKYELVVTSTQYANQPIFKDAYWGHRGYYKYAEIIKADTEATLSADKTTGVKPGDKITVTAKIKPAKNEGTNCAAPKGFVQFFVDGKKVGEPVELTTHNDVKDGNHYYSTASTEITLKNIEGILFGKDNKKVSVEYLGEDANYNSGSKGELDLKLDLVNIDVDGDGNPDVNIDVDKDGKPDLNIDTDGDLKPDVNIDTDGNKQPDINIDTDNTGTWKPSSQNGNADGIWKPDQNIDTNGDGKGDKNHSREPIDKDKDGVDDNWKPNKDVTVGGLTYDTSDPSINIDTNGDGTPDINIDTNGDGKPDLNIDTNGDLKPDVDIDTNGDKKPDLNIDVDGDGKPDINIDTDKDGKPDVNVDLDGNKQPDINIDTDNTGTWKPSGQNGNADGIWKPDQNIDTNGDGKGDKDHSREPIDKDKDGVDDNWKPNKDVTVGGLTYDTSDPSINIDTNGDGTPDINIDTNGDGKPDLNIDTNGDLKPDVDIDTNGDKKPDLNIDVNGDGKPDINIDTNGNGKPDVNIDGNGDGKPDVNIDTNGDLKPDLNVDVDGDGKPDINIDTDKDGKPDVNVDLDGNKQPDINIDTDNTGTWKPSAQGGNNDGVWKPDTGIDTNGDGKGDKDHNRAPVDTDKNGVDDNWNPGKDVTVGDLTYDTSDPSVNVDTNGDGKPDVNIDGNGDGKPDVNIDTNGDLKPDLNVDVDGDGKPDINIDTDQDGKPDINIDLNGDSKPDVNIDTDNTGTWKPSTEGGNGDNIWKPDTNLDTNGDGKVDVEHGFRPGYDIDKDGVEDSWHPDKDVFPGGSDKPGYDTSNPNIDVDTNGDGIPDIDIDTDKDGKPDVNIDTDKDGKPDVNIDTDKDGKPDVNIDTDKDGKPDVNIDTDKDGKPDVNIDTDKDGKPDVNIDTDKDGKPDVNIDTDKDGKPDVNIDTDKDGKPDLNIDINGDGKPDANIDANGDGVIDPTDGPAQTGDAMMLSVWMLLLAVSVGGYAMLIQTKKRIGK